MKYLGPRSFKRAAAVSTATVALCGLTLGYASVASASSTGPAPVGGVTPASSITMWTAAAPDEAPQQPVLAAFTKETGIKVTYDAFPESVMQNKIQAAQEVKSSDFDVYEEPESLTSDYVALHGVAPINSYIKNTTLTPASYDFAGLPTGSYAQCTLGTTQYCFPVDTDPGPEMFYNIGMFKAAGLTPPTTWAQVLTDANKLTTKSVSGICIRGAVSAPNGYPVLLMLPYFLPYAANYKGEYLNANWKPLFDTPQALTWANEYATLMQKDDPPGVSSYSYPQCTQAFNSGQTAMFWDDSTLANTMFEKSMDPKEYANTGIDEIPCPAWNQSCLLSAPWGMYINNNVSKPRQLAAYELMEYLTSPKVQIQMLNQSKDPTVGSRPATIAYAIKQGAAKYGVPTQYLAAIEYASAHIEPNAIPVSAAFAVIQNSLFVTLSQLIAAQITPQQALTQLQSQMTSTLKTFHLPPS
jgi:multiple sugar transport system substrate-binding protein